MLFKVFTLIITILCFEVFADSYRFDFSNNHDNRLKLFSDAKVEDGKAILTPDKCSKVGGVFIKKAHFIDKFKAEFSIFLGSDRRGADGIVFVLVDSLEPLTHIGLGGGELGYGGLKAIGIEFDTYDNYPTYKDPNSNHVGINLNGHLDSVYTNSDIKTLEDGKEHFVHISFNHGAIMMSIDDEVVLNYTIKDFIGFSGFIGFTAGTGASKNLQYIDNFTIKFHSPSKKSKNWFQDRL
jgi:hypothetical protein